MVVPALWEATPQLLLALCAVLRGCEIVDAFLADPGLVLRALPGRRVGGGAGDSNAGPDPNDAQAGAEAQVHS